MHKQIIEKIQNKQAVVGVIGLGYVGLPLFYLFIEKGFRAIGFDVDSKKVESLKRGESYIKHIPSSRIKGIISTGLFSATTDFSKLTECDAIIIAVPTPLSKNREPDMKYIVDTAEVISKYIRKGQLVVLESTTYPGTTVEVLIPIIEKSGLKVDIDFFASFSPEREDPNNPEYNTETIPKVLGSTSKEGLEITNLLYSQIVKKTVPVSSTQVAEAVKLMENIFRSVNIALVNELKITFSRMGIDIWDVIEGAKTKPFGFMPFYPGPGLGGHCIPIDPFYLTWKAREYGVTTKFIELAGEINTAMPDYIVTRVMEVLNLFKKPLRGAKVLVLGLAYKPNVDDARESPSFELMRKLEERGAIVEYNDPYIPIIPMTREHPQYAGKKSVSISKKFDLILVSTDHNEYRKFDFAKLKTPVVDTRNLLKEKNKLFYKA